MHKLLACVKALFVENQTFYVKLIWNN